MTDSADGILGGHLTALSLGALGLALAVGTFGSSSGSQFVTGLSEGLAPIGGVWISALRMTVIPLVLTQLLTALVGPAEGRSLGGLGARVFFLFLAFLSTVSVTSTLVMSQVVGWAPADPGITARILAGTAIPPEAAAMAVSPAGSLGEWVRRLVPANVFAAAVAGDILPLLVCTALFGLAVSRLDEEQRTLLAGLFQGLAKAVLRILLWVLWFTPLAVFALVLDLALSTGGQALGFLLFYVVAVSGWMLVVTGALYPVSALLGGVSLGDFARAVAPAHMVAVSTRSSLASLPALVEGGREHLRFPPAVTGLVLPLSASVFKLSTVTAEPVRFLFLAHLFGLDITLPQTATFLVSLLFLSFTGVGVPGGGSGFDTLPAYAAAGIPLEGLVLVVAVDTIPDVAKTIVNVTGHMAVATISRPMEARRDSARADLTPR
jgi:Na+/H+-dicarboxylate symporter